MKSSDDFINGDFSIDDLLYFDIKNYGNLWVMNPETFMKMVRLKDDVGMPLVCHNADGKTLLGYRVSITKEPCFMKAIL